MSDKTALRPFQVEFAEADLTELRRRIADLEASVTTSK